MKGYLVKTGKYRDNDENKINPAPYKTVNSFSDAVDDIVSSLKEENWIYFVIQSMLLYE